MGAGKGPLLDVHNRIKPGLGCSMFTHPGLNDVDPWAQHKGAFGNLASGSGSPFPKKKQKHHKLRGSQSIILDFGSGVCAASKSGVKFLAEMGDPDTSPSDSATVGTKGDGVAGSSSGSTLPRFGSGLLIGGDAFPTIGLATGRLAGCPRSEGARAPGVSAGSNWVVG